MGTMLNIMKKRKNEIPTEKLAIFENIIQTYSIPGRGSNEGDNKFFEAIGEHFTKEERFRLWEQYGGCRGTGQDKARKAFATFHADKPLPIKINLYLMEFENRHGKTHSIVLDEKNNTITFTFTCDECYKHFLNGKITTPFKLKYEACAGGRLYNLEKALGIKLKIKSVEVSPLGVNIEHPCVFIFEIVK